jgi:hypothetical protein
MQHPFFKINQYQLSSVATIVACIVDVQHNTKQVFDIVKAFECCVYVIVLDKGSLI